MWIHLQHFHQTKEGLGTEFCVRLEWDSLSPHEFQFSMTLSSEFPTYRHCQIHQISACRRVVSLSPPDL